MQNTQGSIFGYKISTLVMSFKPVEITPASHAYPRVQQLLVAICFDSKS